MIVGPGNEGAGAGRHGQMRASDVDREQVIDVLKAAFMQGRLTKDELAERVGKVLAARTYADLDVLTGDIPQGLAAAPLAKPGPARIKAAGDANIRPRDRAIIATATLAGLSFVVAFLINDGAVSALIALGAVLSGFISLVLLTAQLRDERRNKRQAGPPTQHRALGPGPRVDQQAAAASEQLPLEQPRPRTTTDAANPRLSRPPTVAVA